jgi:hypothetical protein
MTAKPPAMRSRHKSTSNLEDPDELKPFAKCPGCKKAYYNKDDALELYLKFFCPCGAFMDMASFSLEFIHRVDRFWKGGKL